MAAPTRPLWFELRLSFRVSPYRLATCRPAPDASRRGTLEWMKNRSRVVLTFAGLGVLCVAASLVLYALLHLLPPSAELDWTRRTISQYALLSNGWAFDTATLLLAAGSLAVLVALRRAGLVRRGAAVALLLWVAGLVGVVWFEKHNWSAGPSLNGDIHRLASLVAFLSLAVHGDARCSQHSAEPYAHNRGIPPHSLHFDTVRRFGVQNRRIAGRARRERGLIRECPG